MPGARRWRRAATAFLGALPDDARRRAVIAFGDKERFNWHYVPRGREGLPFKAMPAPARAAAHELMKASLSAVGYAKAVNVIRLEAVLRQLETFGGLLRDAENYSVTVFGAPDSTAAPWGWRLEGHHLSLNFTLVPGKPVAVTPAFFGANPAEVRSGPLKGLRTLAREQDLGRALAQGMDAAQRRRMTISAQSLGDIVAGPGRGESLASQVGLPAVDLTPPQRELLVQLVEEYARNMRPELAEEQLRRIREAGVERIHFAWAGPIEPGHAHYYRIHGPTVLIELDNTQNDANHIHSVWHDPRNDFGADLLRAHYERGPPAPARLSSSRHRLARPGHAPGQVAIQEGIRHCRCPIVFISLGPRAVERARSPQRWRQGMAIATWTPTTSIGFRPIPRTSKRGHERRGWHCSHPHSCSRRLGCCRDLYAGGGTLSSRSSTWLYFLSSQRRFGCLACERERPCATAIRLSHRAATSTAPTSRSLTGPAATTRVAPRCGVELFTKLGSRHCPARFSGWRAIVPSPSHRPPA